MLLGQFDESCCGFVPPPAEPSESNRVVQRPAQRVVIEPLDEDSERDPPT
jgi:hypothetical protein